MVGIALAHLAVRNTLEREHRTPGPGVRERAGSLVSRVWGRLRRLGSPVAWTAYAALPVTGWGLLDGLPLGPLEAGVVGGVWWLWASRGSLPWAPLLVVLTAAKLLLGGSALVDRGFLARYYANPDWSRPHERSVEFPSSPLTRVDSRLRFREGRAPTLPLFFVNDLRFNWHGDDQPTRDKLPFSAWWEGHLSVDRGGPRRLYVRGDGVSAEVTLDGRSVLVLRPHEREGIQSVDVAPGWHRLEIRLSAPYGAGRRFEAGELDRSSGRRRPFSADTVFARPIAGWQIPVDRTIRLLSRVLDVTVLAGLAWLVMMAVVRALRAGLERGSSARDAGPMLEDQGPTGRWGNLLALAWLAAGMDAFYFAMPAARRLIVLSGGDDWLTYESFARDIVLNGPLMTLGAPLGQGAPYYYQALYPYFLAVTHLVFGEDLFGVFVVQRFLVAVTAWNVWRLTRLLFGTHAALIVLLAGTPFLYLTAGRLAGVLLGELLFIPLVTLWVLLSVSLVSCPSGKGALVAGAVGGAATLARSSLLLGWIPALPILGLALRRRHGILWPVGVLTVAMIAVVGLATARNWVVSHRFVVISSAFPLALRIGNEPPSSVGPPPAGRQSIYDRLGLDVNIRAVAEYAIQAPPLFLRNLLNKAVYAGGCYSALPQRGGILHSRPPELTRTPSVGCSMLYLSVWVIAGVGVACRLGRDLADGLPGPARALPGLVGLSHFAVVVAILPHTYGDRHILPIYVLLLPHAAAGLAGLWKRVCARAPGSM